jgi:uncharacterized membrane protein
MRKYGEVPPESGDKELELARSLTMFVYVMHALAAATLVTFFVAIFVNNSRRHRVAGTIYESHFTWQIRTFWYSLLYFGLACLFFVWAGILYSNGHSAWGMVALGLLIRLFNLCWHISRVIRGFMNWSDRKPMPV